MNKYDTPLSRALQKVPAGDLSDVLDEITSELGIGMASLRTKIRGSRPVKKLERQALKKIFKKYNVSVEW